jgi:hypothetical protein
MLQKLINHRTLMYLFSTKRSPYCNSRLTQRSLGSNILRLYNKLKKHIESLLRNIIRIKILIKMHKTCFFKLSSI